MGAYYNLFNYVKNLQKCLITTFCLLLLMYFTIKSCQRYIAFETGTSQKYIHISNLTFPEIAFCASDESIKYNKTVLNNHGIESSKIYAVDGFWSSNNTKISNEDLYHSITIKLDKLIKYMDIITHETINEKYQFKLNSEEIRNFVKLKDFDKGGKCFTINIPRNFTSAGIKELSFYAYQNTDIFMYGKEQFFDSNSW